MKKFVFLYKANGSRPAADPEAIMKQWTDWMGSLGSALVDGGNPFEDGAKSVTSAGISEVSAGSAVTGYTIVNAENLDAAVEMAKTCPLHKQEGGVAAVEVYEALPM